MAFGVLAGQITVIFLEVLLGYVGARSGIIKDRDSKFLSDFIMKLLLPCTMLAGAAVDGEPELLTQAGVLFVLLLWLLPLDNVLRTGLSIIACCPAGSLAAVLAKQTGTEATLASQAVAHSTVCMLVTVPAMLLLTGVMFPM